MHWKKGNFECTVGFSDSEVFQAAFSHAEERIRRRGVTSKVCLGQTNSSLILASEDQPKGILFILDTVSWKFRRKLKRVLDPQK